MSDLGMTCRVIQVWCCYSTMTKASIGGATLSRSEGDGSQVECLNGSHQGSKTKLLDCKRSQVWLRPMYSTSLNTKDIQTPTSRTKYRTNSIGSRVRHQATDGGVWRRLRRISNKGNSIGQDSIRTEQDRYGTYKQSVRIMTHQVPGGSPKHNN